MKKIFTIFAALACMMSMSAATWTVAGAPKAVFGSEWDPANTANVMADQGDGNYKWEKSDLTLAASTIEFKVVKGNAWGEEYPGANYRLKINESGVYTITITFNEGTHEVNAVATKQGAAEVIPTIAIAGDMNGWNTTANEFVIADDKKTASLTLALEAKDYGFKMIVAGGWTSDGATITRENNTTVFTGANSDNNCTLTADVAGDYTFTWVYKTNTLTVTYPEAGENPGEEPGDDPVVDPETGVTYNVTVPAGTKACYIAGEMNGWSQQEMTKVDETHYTITIATATATMKYKYCSGPDWAYVEMQADGATDVQDRTYAANDVVEAWKAVYDPAGEEPGDDPVVDPETGITYNVTVPAGTKACYIAGEMNEWKHQEMTKVDETHYTITIATATTAMKYKYCSGPDWAYVEMQADGVTDVQDRTYAANDVVEAWKAVYEPAGEDPTPGEPKDITVKAKVPAAWTEQITAWVWATGGEGQEVVPTQEGEWYVYTQNCVELNIIFKNGAGWNGDANQTVDITVTESTCIEITADGATKATYTVVDCEGGEDSELPTDTVDVYTIAGVTSLVGVNWDPTATINDMIKQEDGTYTLVKTDLQLVANMPYEYKVVKNHSWEIWSIPGWNMGNNTLLVDKSGIYDVTFTLNLVDTALTAVAQLKEELVLIPTVQLAGTMTDWAENAIEMTLSEDSLSASTTVTLLADSVYEFKIIVDGNWKGYDGIVTRDYSIDLVFNSGSNCSLITDVEGEYAFTWTFANNSVSVVYPENNFPKPEPKDITVKAKMPTTWNDVITAWVWPTGGDGRVVEPTQEGEWYVVTENCTELNIIFRNGSEWSTADNKTEDMTFTESTCVQLAQEGGDMATYTVVDCEGDSVVTPDPETGVTYNVTVPAGTKACYIAGEMNSWSFTEMTKIDDTHYTVTLAEATEAMGYKYCSGPGWAYVELTEEDGEVANRTYAANDIVVKWASIYDPANAPTPGEAKDITIKAKVPATWTETITAWVWATGEPGKAVIPTKDGEWYVYTEHCPELNIIFRNGSEWSTVDNKTVDMTFTESTCIQLAQEGGDMATYTVVDCEGGEVIEPAQITYVLMGVGGDWTTGIYLTRNVTALEEEYVLLNQPIAEGDSVKVVTLTDGIPTAWCGNVDEASTVSYTNDEVYGNIVLIPGIYDFYYKVASNMIYIATSITTAVDNITIEKNAIKVIQDGRMYILRDGVMYNVMGQIAE